MWNFATPSILALANNLMLLGLTLSAAYMCVTFSLINTKLDIIKTALLTRISMSEMELKEAVEHELNVQKVAH